MNNQWRHPCGRCGVPTTAEYCMDCRSVDKHMTRNGKNRAELRQERGDAARAAHAERMMMMRVAGYNTDLLNGH